MSVFAISSEIAAAAAAAGEPLYIEASKKMADFFCRIQIRSEERPDWDTFGYQADMTGDGKLIGFIYHHRYGLVAGRGEKAAWTRMATTDL